MGMPDIAIAFKRMAEKVKKRSTMDVVCIITKDTTVSGLHTYTRKDLIDNDKYSDAIFSSILKQGFEKYGVYKILVYSIKEEETLDDALAALKKMKFNWLTFNFKLSEEEQTKIKEFNVLRQKLHKPIEIVVADYAADDKYFINFIATGLKVNNVAMEDYQFAIKVTFILAILPQTKSATFYVLDDVTAVDDIEDENKAVNEGKLFITFDGDKYKLSRAVNSMTTLKDNDKKDMKKIKIVTGSILIHNDIYTAFRDEYVGQCDNEYDDRLKFVAYAGSYLKGIEGSVLKKGANNSIELDSAAMRKYMESDTDDEGETKDAIDTTDMTEDEILADVNGYCGSKVFTIGYVRFADAMEDLSLNLFY